MSSFISLTTALETLIISFTFFKSSSYALVNIVTCEPNCCVFPVKVSTCPVNCVCSHALRVFSSQSPALAARDFRAPPFSGAFALWRLNHCSPLRSIPSWPRSENIRCAWVFSPFAPPRWMASV